MKRMKQVLALLLSLALLLGMCGLAEEPVEAAEAAEPVEELIEEAPAEEAEGYVVEELPAEEAPAEEPVEEAPVKESEEAPIEEEPVEEEPVEEELVEEELVEETIEAEPINADSDFVIEDGVLKKYYGSDANVEIPEGVTSIGDSAFFCEESLVSVNIPSSVISIGKEAFSCCSNLQIVNIPNSVKIIGDDAFSECNALENIDIPGSVESIGDTVFFRCESLQTVNLSEGLVSIGISAFMGCNSLLTIDIPDSVTSIGNSAFGYCTNLKSVTLGDGLKSIGNWFEYLKALETVHIGSGVTSIGESAFAGCELLQTINIPKGVTSIESWAFGGCEALASIDLPDGLVSIGDNAFMGCDALQSIEIPNSVTSIDECAFQYCTSLQSIKLPDNLTDIAPYMLMGCTVLNSIDIPASVASIGESAFINCTDLQSAVIPASVKNIGDDAFTCCNQLVATVEKGSYAEEYCIANEIDYMYTDGTRPQPSIHVSCSPTSCILTQKESVTLKASTEGLSKKESYTFSSSDTNVASVSKSGGKITAKNPGTATITVTGKSSKLTGSCTVTVIPAPTKVSIAKPAKLDYTTDNEPFALAASVEPADAVQGVKWTSSDETVARVSAEGLVTLVGQGKATITAKSEKKGTNGKQRSDSFVLQVMDPHMPASVKIAEKAAGPVYVDKDKTLTLSYELAPVTEGQEAASAVTWSIPKAKERKIATINSVTGEITPIKEGSVTVKITTQKKGGAGKTLKQLSDTVKITVVDPTKPRSVKINGGEKEIPYYYEAGKTLTLQATIEPATATPGVTWSIPSKAHRKIATIDANTGVVTPTGTKYGVVTVKATTQAKKSNKKPATASIKIAVVDPNVVDPKLPYNVTITQKDGVELKDGVQLKVGGTLQLSARILPETATEQTSLSWTIPAKQQKYATVDPDGTVHGVKAGGSVTVTVQTANGKKDTVKIKIVK